jgi:hypothetical protein
MCTASPLLSPHMLREPRHHALVWLDPINWRRIRRRSDETGQPSWSDISVGGAGIIGRLPSRSLPGSRVRWTKPPCSASNSYRISLPSGARQWCASSSTLVCSVSPPLSAIAAIERLSPQISCSKHPARYSCAAPWEPHLGLLAVAERKKIQPTVRARSCPALCESTRKGRRRDGSPLVGSGTGGDRCLPGP